MRVVAIAHIRIEIHRWVHGCIGTLLCSSLLQRVGLVATAVAAVLMDLFATSVKQAREDPAPLAVTELA